MKNSELIEALQELPGDVEVLIASDEEGNSFNKLYSGPGLYWIPANEDKHGWVESVYSSEDLVELGDDPVEARIVIWP